MQGCLRRQGAFVACAGASLAHTAYKCSLFVFPDVPVRANLLVLGLATFVVGMLFGLMRERLGSVAFPALAHGAFDLVVYGDVAQLPWWIG